MRKALVVAAILLASLALSLPASATSQRTQVQRHLRAVLREGAPKGYGVPSVNSVRCIGAMPFYGKLGSTFTCYVYNRDGRGLGVLDGTNLGSNGANLEWYAGL